MKRIDNREFVVTYMNSTSNDEVATHMNMTRGGVTSKANYLRKLGVRLPKMDRRLKDNALEVAALNSLIKKHTNQ